MRLTSGSSDNGPGRRLLPVVVGPTGAGKTAAAVLAAERLNGEVVGADSRQVYRGMEVGTGAPSPEELSRVRHHLVGTIEPHERLSAGGYARMAQTAIEDIITRGRVPLVVGGSGLYVRALVDGLAAIPESSPELRRSIEDEIDRRGMEALRGELAAVDPEYARLVGPHDRKRLVRALEVYRATGVPFSRWHRRETAAPLYCPLMLGLTRPRPELADRIARRVRKMVAAGWLEETGRLLERYGGRLPPAVSEAVGYRDIIAHIQGAMELEDALERTVIATRQLAKRQMTWFRGDERIRWMEAPGDTAVGGWADWITQEIRAALETGTAQSERGAP